MKNITLTSGKHYVVNRYNLLSAIRQNIEKAGVQLSSDKIDFLFERLYPLTKIDEYGKMMHIRSIQQKTQDNTSQIASMSVTASDTVKTLCPYCGGKLVVRIAARGDYQGKKFLGCSNYPKCRYTKNVG